MNRVLTHIDGWFTRPSANAAGQVGLYRIVFGLGYLWHVSLFDVGAIVGAPNPPREALPFLQLVPSATSSGALQGLEMVLVGALVLLVAGLWVPMSTAVVLVAGIAREGYFSQFDIENGNLMLVFLIPLLALVSSVWGETYSLDAWRYRRRDGTASESTNDAWSFALLARASIVLLAVLFPIAGILKMTGNGTWLRDGSLLPALMLERSVDASLMGWFANPLGPWFATHASWGIWLQAGVIVFELSFVLLLMGGTVRRVMLGFAMVFHALSALVLLVSFNGVLAAYGTLVDWESGWQQIRVRRPLPALRQRAGALGPFVWSVGAGVLAVAIAFSWHQGAADVFNVWGLLTWRTPWLVVAPVAIVGLLWRQWRASSLHAQRTKQRRGG